MEGNNISKLLKLVTLILFGFFAQMNLVNAQACNSPASTPFNTNNGQDGIMFTITAKRNIVIDTFENNYAAGTLSQILVYYRYGTATGYITTPGAWTLLGSVNNVTSAGVNNSTVIPLNINLPVNKYQTVAFYITTNGGTNPICRYTNGSTVCDSLGGNGDLVLHEGYGKDYPFGASFSPREFNGKVRYHCVATPNFTINGNLTFCNAYNGQQEPYNISPPLHGSDIYWTLPSGMSIVGNANNDSVLIQFSNSNPSGQICAAILGCDGDTVVKICETIISNPPQADAGPDTSICSQPYQLQGNQGTGYWQVMSGSGTFANANIYNTTVSGLSPGANVLRWTVGGNGCPITSDDVQITLLPQPIANFSHSAVCDGIGMPIQNTSYALGGSIIAWSWDVDGNGSVDYTSSQVNHVFPDSGNYQCRLLVTANGGCTDTVVKTVRVHPNPETSFTFDPECELTPTPFTDQSVIGTGDVTSWYWLFGDGATSNVQHPSHTYGSDGVYIVSLMAYSAFGCSTPFTDSVEVFTIPDVDFTAPSVCRNDTVKLNDISTSIQGAINYWEWDFGDSYPTDFNQNTTHQYLAFGSYDIALTVATDKGCTNTVVKNIDIYPVPVPDFIQIGECERQAVKFEDNSQLSGMFGSQLDNWEWEFGDGNSANNETVGNFYQAPGYYKVLHTPYSNYGCHTTEETEILIRPKPRAHILVKDDHVCAQNAISFQDETYFDYQYDAIGVIDWSWSFGDGQTSNLQDPQNTFAEGGLYNTELYVETTYGCYDSAERATIVYHNPVAGFEPDTLEGCSPHCVTFIDKSYVKNGDLLSYAWDFGDQSKSQNVNPTHCYTLEDGSMDVEYPVSLQVTTPYGCEDKWRMEEKITIHAKPYVAFELSESWIHMLDPKVEIVNYTEGAATWEWTFGDGSFSDEQDPLEHVYDSAGTYIITLKSTSDYGCENEYQYEIIVEPHLTIYIPNSFSPNHDGINDYFEIKGDGIEYVALWVYDRWGNELFFGENEAAIWDGKVNGKVMPIGNYLYVLEYKIQNQIKQKKYGNFILFKGRE